MTAYPLNEALLRRTRRTRPAFCPEAEWWPQRSAEENGGYGREPQNKFAWLHLTPRRRHNRLVRTGIGERRVGQIAAGPEPVGDADRQLRQHALQRARPDQCV